ncbi:MAG: hypothetical protein ACM3SV_14060 [Betaproteobacteria bacterium]
MLLTRDTPPPPRPLVSLLRRFGSHAVVASLFAGLLGATSAWAAYPTLGKGQRNLQLTPQRYDSSGVPRDDSTFSNPPAPTPTYTVSSVSGLIQALQNARAGQVIKIAPGTYRVTQRLDMAAGGTPTSPILVTATPGTVVLEMDTVEGFRVTQPYWVFENLTIRGVCAIDNNCEHAFHVVRDARGTVIRNNRLENFNAQIKVNGEVGLWPDYGLVQYNTITNTRPRTTDNPVDAIDLVGANQWRYADNVISNIIHLGGNGVSYAMFQKGASQQGRIERNLVVCTDPNKYYPGARVGISFGGGGTGASVCRDLACKYEHNEGVAVNNVVAHCNDSGMDVNRSSNITLAHNTVIDTIGIDLRTTPASAKVYGNMLEGRISARSGAVFLDNRANYVGSLVSVFMDPYNLDLRFRNAPSLIYTAWSAPHDFCRIPRAQYSLPGAFGAVTGCPPTGSGAPGTTVATTTTTTTGVSTTTVGDTTTTTRTVASDR